MMCLTPPWDGLGGIRIPHGCRRAEQRKGKEARNEKSLAPIIKQNVERGKRMAKQKDGRYRAKITVGTDASGKSIVKYVSGRTKKRVGSGESGGA